MTNRGGFREVREGRVHPLAQLITATSDTAHNQIKSLSLCCTNFVNLGGGEVRHPSIADAC